jgi:uncharacterized protein YbjT (DUF2867 family)
VSDHTVTLFGATGLVGRECLRLLLERAEFSRILIVVRRPVNLDLSPAHQRKVELRPIDFARMASYANLFAVDQLLCALGTTIRKAGSQEAFRTVDFEYPSQIARLGVEHGARHFLLVSALGANARSSVFYNRVKGELEDAVLALPYRAHTIIRPSLLLGEREEFRLGEKIGETLSFLAPRKYKPVPARDVARTLIDAAAADHPGVRIIESQQIQRGGMPMT